MRYAVQHYGRAGFAGRRNYKPFNDLAAAFGHAEALARRQLARLGMPGLQLKRCNWGFSICDHAGRYVAGGPVITMAKGA